jgi:hypothetical protein
VRTGIEMRTASRKQSRAVIVRGRGHVAFHESADVRSSLGARRSILGSQRNSDQQEGENN